MNCRPGDLAVILSGANPPRFTGWIVEVLFEAPPAWFLAPDGVNHQPSAPGNWFVKSFCGSFGTVRWPDLGPSEVRTPYAVIADAILKPLRGDPDAEGEPRDVNVPERDQYPVGV